MLCTAVAGDISHSRHEILKVLVKCSTSLAHLNTMAGWHYIGTGPSTQPYGRKADPAAKWGGGVQGGTGWAQEGSGVWHSSPALLGMGCSAKVPCAGCLVPEGGHKEMEILHKISALNTLSRVRWPLSAASPLGLAEPALPVPGLNLAPHCCTSLV